MQCLQTGHWNSDLNYFGIENFIVSKRLFMILLIEWDLENGVEYQSLNSSLITGSQTPTSIRTFMNSFLKIILFTQPFIVESMEGRETVDFRVTDLHFDPHTSTNICLTWLSIFQNNELPVIPYDQARKTDISFIKNKRTIKKNMCNTLILSQTKSVRLFR